MQCYNFTHKLGFTIFSPQICKQQNSYHNIIMRRILLSLLCLVSLSAYAQHTVIVNPDGTHSTAIRNGNTTTIVNSNGTHSTAIHNGNTTTIINSNGTHSTAIRNGNTTTIVNSNGTHTVVVNNGNRATNVNPKWKKWRTPKSNDKWTTSKDSALME